MGFWMFSISPLACSSASSCPMARAASIRFCVMVRAPTGSGRSGLKTLMPDARRRPLQKIEGGVIFLILTGRPGPGHPGKFRISQPPQPAWHRFEPEPIIVRKHHGDVGGPVLQRALDGNGIRHPAVGEGLAVHIIKSAGCQRHGGRGAQGGKNTVIANAEINRFTGMTIREHDEKRVGAFCRASTESGTCCRKR